jgi:hypothetical protein
MRRETSRTLCLGGWPHPREFSQSAHGILTASIVKSSANPWGGGARFFQIICNGGKHLLGEKGRQREPQVARRATASPRRSTRGYIPTSLKGRVRAARLPPGRACAASFPWHPARVAPGADGRTGGLTPRRSPACLPAGDICAPRWCKVRRAPRPTNAGQLILAEFPRAAYAAPLAAPPERSRRRRIGYQSVEKGGQAPRRPWNSALFLNCTGASPRFSTACYHTGFTDDRY